MFDVFSNLAFGLSVALTPTNLALCFVGCLLGTLVGVLPGIGPIATIAILLLITPGESSAVVTTLDGHQMARQGRAGIALGIAAIGSFFAGTVATVVIAM